jgi:hypothetical protein
MTSPPLQLGATPLAPPSGPVSGRLVDAFGERCYVVENAQAMAPFLMTLVSDADLWLYVASNGALTAGRRSPATALFPYVTEDLVYDAVGTSGPVTALRVARGGRRHLWRPLRDADRLSYRVVRRVYKSVLGHLLVFEESNLDLGVTFRAGWRMSAAHGFVRECAVANDGETPASVEALDGLQNVLPADVDDQLQRELSVLTDAYKRTERVPGTSLVVFTLQAQIVDRAEPRESLHANTVWSQGLPGARVLLEAGAVDRFERGLPQEEPVETRGLRGAYLLEGAADLPPGGEARWALVADVRRTQHQVAALAEALRAPAQLWEAVTADLLRGADRLRAIVAATDGLQRTADELATAHHVANVLMNDLRGGVPAAGNDVPGADLRDFVRRMNPGVAARHAAFLAGLSAREPRAALLARVEALGDPDLFRLVLEHLPLVFSRRHGDPSRPWNRFDIQVRDAEGNERVAYQGNWRDIFQNWEALALSYPELLESFVARFLDASTADGNNPYRVSSDGVEWEVPEPNNAWSNIGYWGDHQIVYLHRLLDLSVRYHPDRLRRLLTRPVFTYVEVPYELAPFDAVVANPRATIRFDAARHAAVMARVKAQGGDGRLLQGADGPRRVTLAEKLVVPALAKLASLVPGGGIWMNTQRPEWNDANNALVGFGLSVVTLSQLASYLAFLPALLGAVAGEEVPVSAEVATWLDATVAALERHRPLLERATTDDLERGAFMEALGRPASAYRTALYRGGLSAPVPVPGARLLRLAELGLAFTRHALAQNRRADGLYHAYNLLAPRGAGRGYGVERLYEMLEGQVAALASGAVPPAEAVQVLAALRRSPLYREDQRSYLLYPERALPGFLARNVVPEETVAGSAALRGLLSTGGAAGPDAGEAVVRRDAQGRVRFRETFHNAERCQEALGALVAAGRLSQADAAAVLEIHEQVFQHRAFTGRSGTMYGYEGLGCVYWHMVGKLLVATQEQAFAAAEAGAPPATQRALAEAHRAIRDGMAGTRKTPLAYGAFPLDPYSHTPRHSGARQPGMTGQVKEEVIARMGELGVRVRDGRLRFRPLLLDRAELLTAPDALRYLDVDGTWARLPLAAGSLAFTTCQVPVVYRAADRARIRVTDRAGAVRTVEGVALDAATSAEIFQRTGKVRCLEVEVVLG